MVQYIGTLKTFLISRIFWKYFLIVCFFRKKQCLVKTREYIYESIFHTNKKILLTYLQNFRGKKINIKDEHICHITYIHIVLTTIHIFFCFFFGGGEGGRTFLLGVLWKKQHPRTLSPPKPKTLFKPKTLSKIKSSPLPPPPQKKKKTPEWIAHPPPKILLMNSAVINFQNLWNWLWKIFKIIYSWIHWKYLGVVGGLFILEVFFSFFWKGRGV